MNTTIDSNSEALDYALVQCLRLFAQLGRKIRTQKLLSERILLVKMEDMKDLNDKGPIQKWFDRILGERWVIQIASV